MSRSLPLSVVLFALLSLLIAACGSEASSDAGIADRKIEAVATTGMIGDAVRNVGGDRVEVTALMGPGVDPHLYKASAGDVEKLDEADIIFFNGLHLEGRMTDIFDRLAESKPAVAVADGIDESRLRQPPEFEGKFDPHVWFDVTLWIEVVRAVEGALVDLDPTHRATYKSNADAYVAELEELDGWIQERIATIPESARVLITAHDAFGYFGQRYGVEVRGLQGTSTATEAGAADVQDLADFIAERQIPAIFVESSVPQETIEAVQKAVESRGWNVQIGGQLFSDAMGAEGTDEGTYLGMVRFNVNTIVTALGGS